MAKNSEAEKLLADLLADTAKITNKKDRKVKRRPIWTCDAETDPFRKGRVPKPFIWGIYTEDKQYYQFTDTEKLVTLLSNENVIVYAHNGGKFDWHFLTEYIADFEPLSVIAGRLAKFKIGECEFRDSYNIIPAPLSAYKKDEIDYCIFEAEERIKPENWNKIETYLKSDCIYLHEMIMEFINRYGVNLTQASAAMKIWSKMSGISKPKSSEDYYQEMCKYYYGGRVQCFEKGIIENEFDVADINSAYPKAMTEKHPWGMTYNKSTELPDNDDEISRCFITLKAASMGAFPIRGEHGLSFPDDGEIKEFHITGWEYLAARDTKTLANCEILLVREYLDTIEFNEYVNHFYNQKDEAKAIGDTAGYIFAKLFLNSLYGKFASNPSKYQEFMTAPASMIESLEEDGWQYCKLLSEDTAVVNKNLDEEKRRFYDVAVAASITGYVRAYLWRSICQCEGVLYCDTDSIAARKINGLIISDKLGDWEIEAKCDKAAIAGKKLYAFHKKPGTYDLNKNSAWKIASKGVRLTPEDIIDIASGKIIDYEPEIPTFSVKGRSRANGKPSQREPKFQRRKIRLT